MSDIASMPTRELVAEMKEKARKLGDEGNLITCMVINALAYRLSAEADRADLLEAEVAKLKEKIINV